QRLQFKQYDMGKAVIDLYEINVLYLHLSHRQGLGSRKAQPNVEELSTAGNVVSRHRMTFCGTSDVNRALAQVAGSLGRTDDHCAGAVSLEATVEEPKGFGDHPSCAIVLQRQRPSAHEGFFVELRMLAGGDGDRSRSFYRNLVLVKVASRQPREPLHW